MADLQTQQETHSETPEPKKQKKKNEILYFAMRNTKLKIGIIIISFFILLMILGPLFTQFEPRERAGGSAEPPSSAHIMGTTMIREDVFSQFVYGTQSTFLIGFTGGLIGTFLGLTLGFLSGYIGGIVDEIIMMLTNILLVIPTIAILMIMGAYLPYRGVAIQSVTIGLLAWPWVARTVRAQTMSLKQRGFVKLAKITGVSTRRIIFTEVAPNMLSYVVMVFILQFVGAVLYAVALDFIGLGPTKGISLGLMMQESYLKLGHQLGLWWWFLPPGISITLIAFGMYLMNTGLDEVFNPKLRDL